MKLVGWGGERSMNIEELERAQKIYIYIFFNTFLTTLHSRLDLSSQPGIEPAPFALEA